MIWGPKLTEARLLGRAPQKKGIARLPGVAGAIRIPCAFSEVPAAGEKRRGELRGKVQLAFRLLDASGHAALRQHERMEGDLGTSK